MKMLDVDEDATSNVFGFSVLSKIKTNIVFFEVGDRSEIIMSLASLVFNSKASYRQHVWSHLEKNNIACFPRPVFNRIPNFKSLAKSSVAPGVCGALVAHPCLMYQKGSVEACSKVNELPVFRNARTIKADPDKPLESVRFSVLKVNKTLLVPSPRMKSGLLFKISPPSNASVSALRFCATSNGFKEHGQEIDGSSKATIDLIVVGCVAVSLKGQRIGKGEGFSDIEYALMAKTGMVDPETPILTVVHDCQVFDSMPEELFKEHDVPVDIIVTPTRVHYCEPKRKRPDHIIWSILTQDKIDRIPILQKFKDMEDREKRDQQL